MSALRDLRHYPRRRTLEDVQEWPVIVILALLIVDFLWR